MVTVLILKVIPIQIVIQILVQILIHHVIVTMELIKEMEAFSVV